MYIKGDTEKVDHRYAVAGGVALTGDNDATGKAKVSISATPNIIPADALKANCDSCGAQIWIPASFKDLAVDHRTYCLRCLRLRKMI